MCGNNILLSLIIFKGADLVFCGSGGRISINIKN